MQIVAEICQNRTAGNTSNNSLVQNDFSSSANVQNPSWKPHADGFQDRGEPRVTDTSQTYL
jgi:hypothetical protein